MARLIGFGRRGMVVRSFRSELLVFCSRLAAARHDISAIESFTPCISEVLVATMMKQEGKNRARDVETLRLKVGKSHLIIIHQTNQINDTSSMHLSN